MITIIHGDDIVSSRKYFLEAKEKYSDMQILDGEKVTLTDLAQIFEGGGLFDESKTVFIEHFFNRKKKKEEFSLFVAYLQKQTTHTIFLWEGKELERSSFTLFKTATPRVFKLPQTLFLLLDSIKPHNGKSLVALFHKTIEVAEPEMVFFMLVRQIRLLLGIAQTSDPIDEIKRLAPWQKSKLQKQAEAFTVDELRNIHKNLYSIEIGQKTGTLPTTILTSIDFLLLGI